MSLKKCSECDFHTDDETLEICPECGNKLMQNPGTDEKDVYADEAVVCEEVREDCANADDAFYDEDDSDVKPKADKKVKIITASVAFVLVLLIGFFGWYMWSGKKANEPADLGFDEISGEFVNFDGFQYINFEIAETQKEVVLAEPSEDTATDSDAASDAAASSDADKEPVKELVTFDGTYESGYTVEYVQDILALEYINRNNLSEEYKAYLEKNNVIADDRGGFIKEKGIDQADLDKIDKELNLSVQREEYISNGYWKYDEEAGLIGLYDQSGKFMANFEITGNVIASESTFYRGNKYNSEKFEGSYVGGDDQYTDTWYFYKDGNCIVKSEFNQDSQSQYNAGTYKSDKNYIAVNIGGQSQLFVKVKGGITMFAFAKQK